MDERPLQEYARAIRGALPPNIFNPVPSRLAWLALHVAIVAAGITAITLHWGGTLGALGCSLLVGQSFAGMAFVGHETLHGAVVRHSGWRQAIGWLCFVPFTLSPRLWVAWHNRVHHGHTMDPTIDPDAYPTLEQFRASRLTRIADQFSIGHRRWLGWLALPIGFTGQSAQILWRMARPLHYLSKSEHRKAIAETLAGVALWIAIGVLVGPRAILFGFALPLLVGNAIVMGYIFTNHSLSPHTKVNDPLLNSLTVTVPWPIAMLHLNFGLHVEHHLFPAMSSAYAPIITRALLERWPDRYQSMPMWRALNRLFRTSRVYADAHTLIEPATGRRWPTLQPRLTKRALEPTPSELVGADVMPPKPALGAI